MSSFDDLKKASDRASNRQPSTTNTRARDVAGGYSNPRPAGDTSGEGRSADFGSAGGQAQGTARKTYKARAKYTEYLDNKQNLQRLARKGTITPGLTTDTISFSRNEDENAYMAESAQVFAFENDNSMCDGGNSLACQRAGRGSAPTEYASPFKESPHFNDVAYFGGGGRNMTTMMRTATEVEAEPEAPEDPRYARTGTYAYEGESNGARANRLIREARATALELEAEVEADGEVVPPEVDRDIVPSTGGSSGGQPQHNPAGAGAGSHSGADGSGTHEPPGVVSFDSGGLGVAQPNPTRVYLNNLAGLVDPYSIDKRQCKNDPKHMQF